MEIKIGQWFQRTATLVVIHYNEETGTVTCVNDLGAEVIIQERDLRAVYYAKKILIGE